MKLIRDLIVVAIFANFVLTKPLHVANDYNGKSADLTRTVREARLPEEEEDYNCPIISEFLREKKFALSVKEETALAAYLGTNAH